MPDIFQAIGDSLVGTLGDYSEIRMLESSPEPGPRKSPLHFTTPSRFKAVTEIVPPRTMAPAEPAGMTFEETNGVFRASGVASTSGNSLTVSFSYERPTGQMRGRVRRLHSRLRRHGSQVEVADRS